MAFIIKRKVSLEFLGDDYKESYVNFTAIPLVELDSIEQNLKEAGKDNAKIARLMIDVLKKYFVDGVHASDKIVAEDIEKFDGKTATLCFMRLTGQELDPKDEGQSLTQSQTEVQPQ